MRLWSEKETCAYPPCGCSLNQVHHLFKAAGGHRYYCQEAHRTMGEEQYLRRKAHAAGFQSHWMVAVAGMIALAMIVFATTPKVRAHDHEGVSYGDWKQSNGVSCCNDNDCQPATATMNENGSWIAFFKGRSVVIPKDKVLSIPSPDGRSHICIPPDGMVPYCFVPGEIRS
jgi:hypothetical protein